eukprot:s868_g9.t1
MDDVEIEEKQRENALGTKMTPNQANTALNGANHICLESRLQNLWPAMDGTDKDLGWEDVGGRGVAGRPAVGGSLEGNNISDAVTSAMMNQFARELTTNSLSLWPQFVQTTRRYFNVHHGYVLRKILWQLIPFHRLKVQQICTPHGATFSATQSYQPAKSEPRRWKSGEESLRSFAEGVKEAATRPTGREKAYMAFLSAIADWGLLKALPTELIGGGAGPLVRVSLPFCGALSEAPMLLPFLLNQLRTFISEKVQLHDWTAYTLGDACSLKCQLQDLAEENLPSSAFGLVLGIHPLVSGVACDIPWCKIICKPGGRCIFATFYLFEAEKVQRICKELGFATHLRENPYYVGVPRSQAGTDLRFIVVTMIPDVLCGR